MIDFPKLKNKFAVLVVNKIQNLGFVDYKTTWTGRNPVRLVYTFENSRPSDETIYFLLRLKTASCSLRDIYNIRISAHKPRKCEIDMRKCVNSAGQIDIETFNGQWSYIESEIKNHDRYKAVMV